VSLQFGKFVEMG